MILSLLAQQKSSFKKIIAFKKFFLIVAKKQLISFVIGNENDLLAFSIFIN